MQAFIPLVVFYQFPHAFSGFKVNTMILGQGYAKFWQIWGDAGFKDVKRDMRQITWRIYHVPSYNSFTKGISQLFGQFPSFCVHCWKTYFIHLYDFENLSLVLCFLKLDVESCIFYSSFRFCIVFMINASCSGCFGCLVTSDEWRVTKEGTGGRKKKSELSRHLFCLTFMGVSEIR